MEPKFEKKPTEALIDRYCKKLEEFLSAHDVSVSIELRNHPLKMEMYTNGKLTSIINLWIEGIIVNSNKIGLKNFKISLIRHGIDEDISDSDIWHDAYWIQNQMYRQLKLIPGNPLDKNDTYWKLWDHQRKLKE